MTTNQTIDGVPRELRDLLERVATEANHMLGFTYAANYDECRSAVDELRALLDAERCTSCDDSGDLTDLTGEWRGYCVCPIGVALKNKPAARPQGEPFYMKPQYLSVPGLWIECKEGEIHAKPFYAEQPAPVSVVLPERKTWDGLRATACNLKGEAWNACLDELKRLNPSL